MQEYSDVLWSIPMPVIKNVRLVNPRTGKHVDYWAIVDTGGDYSLCPVRIIQYLFPTQSKEGIDPADDAGDDEPDPEYELRVEIADEGIVVDGVRVFPHEEDGDIPEYEFILGRPVINKWHIHLRPTHGDTGEFDILAGDDIPPSAPRSAPTS